MLKKLFTDDSETAQYMIFLLTSEESTTQTIIEIVREAGYQVHAATTGQEAITLLDQPPLPDILILDLLIPDMETPQFLETIRQRLGRTELPPVLLLGSDREGEAVANQLQVEDYLQKPFDSQTLLTHLSQLIEKKTSS